MEPGEIVTVAGTNGAGKSTLIKTLMGLVPRCRGRLVFDGHDLLRLAPEDRVGIGIGYVPQVGNVFGSLSVVDKFEGGRGAWPGRPGGSRRCWPGFPALAARKGVAARSLSGGERQQLAFARATMARPRLVLLDEPTAALSPNLMHAGVRAHQARCRPRSTAVLLVEQRARQALAISDRGYILDQGRVVLDGPAPASWLTQAWPRLYLGSAWPGSS